VLNAPVRGALELTDIAMVGIAFLGLAQAQHITIDLVYEQLPIQAQHVLDRLGQAMSVTLSALVTWQLVMYMLRTQKDHEVTAVLALPLHAAVAVAVIGFALFACATWSRP
jgi:TRAP-type C4-dicarboxylate transport system permease small subunit